MNRGPRRGPRIACVAGAAAPCLPGRATLLGIALVIAARLGCATGGAVATPTAAPASPIASAVTPAQPVAAPVAPMTPLPGRGTMPPPSPPRGTDLQSAVDAALADAARRTGMAATALKLVGAESVTWSDASLGCPQPGMLYTQALVPGYRIRIDAGGEILDYHAGARGGAPRLCPPGRALPPVGTDPRV